FFEPFFDLALSLRVFFLAMIFTRSPASQTGPTRLLPIWVSDYQYARMMIQFDSLGLDRPCDWETLHKLLRLLGRSVSELVRDGLKDWRRIVFNLTMI